MASPQERPGQERTIQIHSGPAVRVTRLNGTARVRPAVEVRVDPGETALSAVFLTSLLKVSTVVAAST